MPVLALPAASLVNIGALGAPGKPSAEVPTSNAASLARPALDETACVEHFAGTAQRLDLSVRGRVLTVRVRYECRLPSGSLQPLSAANVTVSVRAAGSAGQRLLHARTGADGWAVARLPLAGPGETDVVAEMPGFPGFDGCHPTACLPGDPIDGGIDVKAATPDESANGRQPPSNTTTPKPTKNTTKVTPVPLRPSPDLGRRGVSAPGQPTGQSSRARTIQGTGTNEGREHAQSSSRSPRHIEDARRGHQAAEGGPTSSRPTSEPARAASSVKRRPALAAGGADDAEGARGEVQVLPASSDSAQGSSPLGGAGEPVGVVALAGIVAGLSVLGLRARGRLRLLHGPGRSLEPTSGLGAWGVVDVDEPPATAEPTPTGSPPPTHAAAGGVDYWIPGR
jgi:hypothetical protein